MGIRLNERGQQLKNSTYLPLERSSHTDSQLYVRMYRASVCTHAVTSVLRVGSFSHGNAPMELREEQNVDGRGDTSACNILTRDADAQSAQLGRNAR